tara:strand:+ start:377 stop:583 length:207 start_codon:yes stop_codon:yes gene_type:complete
MGRIKDTIPEDYSCIHYLDVEQCFDCMHAMSSTTQYNANEYPQQPTKRDLTKKQFHNKKKRRVYGKRR